MIHVIATIEVHPGKRADFLAEFHKLVPKVREEKGCIEYGPAVDVAAVLPIPTPLREDVVTVIEKWDSLNALTLHLGASHMLEYRQRVKDLVKSVQLQVLAPA
jgi:quinol monooxygenase YgiN